MPTATPWNVEWLNANEQRLFPLAYFADPVDVTGTFRLPDDFLVGLYWPVHAAALVDPLRFFVHTFVNDSGGYVLTLGYDDGAGTVTDVAGVSFPRAGHVEGHSYAVNGIDAPGTGPGAGLGGFADSVGQVQVGVLASVDAQPPGVWTFAYAKTPLDPSCVRPVIRGVTSVTVVNGTDRSPALTGDIELTAGDNVRLSYQTVTTSGGTYSQIRIDCDATAGASSPCSCVTDHTVPVPIRTINGVPGTPLGAFTLQAGNCMAVAAATNGIAVTDTCSTPCCGPTELNALYQELSYMGDEATTLRNYANGLGAQVTNTGAVILGSKLSDAPCVVCP